MATARQLRQASALSEGVFECERCRRILPDSQLKIEDGRWLCKDRCQNLWSKNEDILKLAAAEAITDPWTPLPRAPRGVTQDAPCVTGIDPRPLRLTVFTPGGFDGTVELTGVNLSSSDTVSCGHASIDVTPTVNSSTSVTLYIQAFTALVPRGYYPIIYNGTRFRQSIIL